MKLLLRRDIPNVGLAGDVVEVKEGYARNYLIPYHLGVLPTTANMKAIEEDKKRAEEERRLRRSALEKQAERMRDIEVTIASACNPEGRLYGSVGPREIAAALRDEGHDVEAKQVQLREPLRQIDNITVPVMFAEDLVVEVKVWIVRESGSGEIEEEEPTAHHDFDAQDRRGGREGDRYGRGNEVDAIETDL
ncbi:MAG: 50S ribosomal protein L9 [Phycisphaerae bacterium]|nr:50S ribosomal protein L9 [Phycisphaerae bacterium]